MVINPYNGDIYIAGAASSYAMGDYMPKPPYPFLMHIALSELQSQLATTITSMISGQMPTDGTNYQIVPHQWLWQVTAEFLFYVRTEME